MTTAFAELKDMKIRCHNVLFLRFAKNAAYLMSYSFISALKFIQKFDSCSICYLYCSSSFDVIHDLTSAAHHNIFIFICKEVPVEINRLLIQMGRDSQFCTAHPCHSLNLLQGIPCTLIFSKVWKISSTVWFAYSSRLWCVNCVENRNLFIGCSSFNFCLILDIRQGLFIFFL